MVVHANSSEDLPAPHDRAADLGWDPSTPVLAEMAKRVRSRLASEAEGSHGVFGDHSASIASDS